MIGVQHRSGTGEFRRGRLLGVGGDLFVAIDELTDLFLQLGQLPEHAINLLEVGDDLALRRLALGIPGRAIELPRDGIVFPAQHRDR